MIDELKALTAKDVDRRTAELLGLSHAVHADPETAFAEHRACARTAERLAAGGFTVETPVAELPTAFAATVGTGRLHVALFAEYDALPGLGHACGHNIICAAAVGAGLALAPFVDDLDLTLTVFGTPAEEHGAGKVLMLERGAFAGVHAGLMVHPGPFDAPAPVTTALGRYAVRATGRAAHAGATPFLGVNAADALVLAQTAIGLLRQHLVPGDQIQGIVTSAGSTPNVIADLATADYLLRAPTLAALARLETRVRACFAAGGLGTGARVTMEPAQPVLSELHTDDGLLRRWTANHGTPNGTAVAVPISTDLGTVSASIPCIHPIIGIGSWPVVNHQPGFAAAAVTPQADAALLRAATALAATVVDVASDPVERNRLLDRSTPTAIGAPS